jgi:hypothetical protein
MNTQEIYIAYETDVWLSNNDRKMLYIGENLSDVVVQVGELYSMTYKQRQEFFEEKQFTLKGVGLIIETYRLNCFV